MDDLHHAPSRGLLDAARDPSVTLYTLLIELLQRHPVTGAPVFDLQIVATMQANNIHRIYTFNTGDFKVFPGITVMTL